jgi:5-formyltetrahydrofolate cyclo-ligase
MLAGNIVQVRPERKALSAAVGPTCCSGREQRSKTASVGGAILLQMKATLRKQLRVARNAMSEPDHRHRSVIRDRRHCRLRFYPLTEATAPGELGISVPRLRVTPVSLQWMNLIVMPLVGVDGEGRRLGMGGGYYDRALAFRRRRRYWKGPHRSESRLNAGART